MLLFSFKIAAAISIQNRCLLPDIHAPPRGGFERHVAEAVLPGKQTQGAGAQGMQARESFYLRPAAGGRAPEGPRRRQAASHDQGHPVKRRGPAARSGAGVTSRELRPLHGEHSHAQAPHHAR